MSPTSLIWDIPGKTSMSKTSTAHITDPCVCAWRWRTIIPRLPRRCLRKWAPRT
ncbi:MAG: hypothetical protein MZV64_00315 [Ignavibacteriales bacterium]|nr:hypothetical protein [Ignavibacteriales bacterium]